MYNLLSNYIFWKLYVSIEQLYTDTILHRYQSDRHGSHKINYIKTIRFSELYGMYIQWNVQYHNKIYTILHNNWKLLNTINRWH